MDAIFFATVSMLALAGNSLVATRLLKTKECCSSSVITSLSLFPAFLVSLSCVEFVSYNISFHELTLMLGKNGLYGLAFFLRIKSLNHFGAFGGAVFLTAQPILVSIFAWVFLGERLGIYEIGAVGLTAVGLWVVNSARVRTKYTLGLLLVYLVLPALLISTVMVADKYILLGQISGTQFFVFDKLTLFPAFLFMRLVFRWLGSERSNGNRFCPSAMYQLFSMLLLGGLWGLSSWSYGLALELEKTAWVAVIRSMSFPLVAIVGCLVFSEKINGKAFLGLGLVFIGGVVASIA